MVRSVDYFIIFLYGSLLSFYLPRSYLLLQLLCIGQLLSGPSLERVDTRCVVQMLNAACTALGPRGLLLAGVVGGVCVRVDVGVEGCIVCVAASAVLQLFFLLHR